MNTVAIELVLDLSKINRRLNEITRIRQSELNSTTLQASILDHNKEFDLSECKAELHFKKPNGEVYVEAAQIKDNKVNCTLNSDITAISGNAMAYFQIFNKDKSIVNTTSTFYLQILPALIPVKKKDPNEPQPIDLQIMKTKNEQKGEGIYFG